MLGPVKGTSGTGRSSRASRSVSSSWAPAGARSPDSNPAARCCFPFSPIPKAPLLGGDEWPLGTRQGTWAGAPGRSLRVVPCGIPHACGRPLPAPQPCRPPSPAGSAAPQRSREAHTPAREPAAWRPLVWEGDPQHPKGCPSGTQELGPLPRLPGGTQRRRSRSSGAFPVARCHLWKVPGISRAVRAGGARGRSQGDARPAASGLRRRPRDAFWDISSDLPGSPGA